MRDFIQSQLDKTTSIESGPFISESILEEGTTYFGYQLQEDFINSNFDNDFNMKVNILGFVMRKENTSENTLKIIDEAKDEIIKVLKKSNFKTSYKDVSLENGIRKIQITANAKYNDKFKKII